MTVTKACPYMVKYLQIIIFSGAMEPIILGFDMYNWLYPNNVCFSGFLVIIPYQCVFLNEVSIINMYQIFYPLTL